MFKNQKIIKLFTELILVSFLLYSCVGSSSVGVFGSGVSVAFDPRTVGMQIDDSIMQKNLIGRLALTDKKYIINISSKVLTLLFKILINFIMLFLMYLPEL